MSYGVLFGRVLECLIALFGRVLQRLMLPQPRELAVGDVFDYMVGVQPPVTGPRAVKHSRLTKTESVYESRTILS